MTPYRLLVTGPRYFRDKKIVWSLLAEAVKDVPPDREIVIVHGATPTRQGVDWIADNWGRALGATVEPHPAVGHPTQDFGSWPEAGPRRNAYLVRLGADRCVAVMVWCTSSRCRRPDAHYSHGTSDCVDRAERARIPVTRWYAQ